VALISDFGGAAGVTDAEEALGPAQIEAGRIEDGVVLEEAAPGDAEAGGGPVSGPTPPA